MNILAIGNSFSQDATRYLHAVMLSGGVAGRVVNLYIGGCSLEQHWRNAQTDSAGYLYELNGESTGRYVSIAQALAEGGWDVITLQQASHDSGLERTYFPYLEELLAYVRRAAPKARVLLHETWAYERDSTHPQFPRYHCDQAEMYASLRGAYAAAAQRCGLDMLPCGDVVQAVRGRAPFVYEAGGLSLCRDGFHMSLTYGRYLLAAVWYETLTGRSIYSSSYAPCAPLAPEGESVDGAALNVIRAAVHERCGGR